MDEVATGLCHELFRIARGAPELGTSCDQRLDDVFRQLKACSLVSANTELLLSAQALMRDWAAPQGWHRYGDTPEALRGQIVESLGALVACAFPDMHAPDRSSSSESSWRLGNAGHTVNT